MVIPQNLSCAVTGEIGKGAGSPSPRLGGDIRRQGLAESLEDNSLLVRSQVEAVAVTKGQILKANGSFLQ